MATTAGEAFDVLSENFAEAVEAGDYDDDLNSFMADEVVPVWKSNSPDDTGTYIDSVQITQPAEQGHGQVGATDPIANIIEYGSVDTPEFAPRAATIAEFEKR